MILASYFFTLNFHFPPEKPGERSKLFQSLVPLPWTLCFYVSPHKAARQVEEIREVLGDRRAALVREISKVHQEALRGRLSELLARLEAGLKGEMVLVVEGCLSGTAAVSDEDWRAEADALRETGKTVKETVQEITARFPVAKNAVKEYLIHALPPD